VPLGRSEKFILCFLSSKGTYCIVRYTAKCVCVCVCVCVYNSPQNSVYFKIMTCSVQILVTFYVKGAPIFKYPPRAINVNVSSDTTNTTNWVGGRGGEGAKALSVANQQIGAHVYASSRRKQGNIATYLTASNS